MSGYMANFTVYTMAMTGLICFAVFVYKKITDGTFKSGSGKFLSVEESMSLSPRKTLHVVKAGNEKFLIASDIDRTTLIAKLGQDENKIATEENIDFKEFISNQLPEVSSFSSVKPEPTVIPPKKERRVIHLDTVSPERKRKYGEKRNIKQTDISPIKEMAKRINEL